MVAASCLKCVWTQLKILARRFILLSPTVKTVVEWIMINFSWHLVMQWGGTKWGKRRLNRDSLNENGAPFRLVLSPPLITHKPQLFDLIQQQNSSNCNNFYGCSPRSIFLYFWDQCKHLFLINGNVYIMIKSLYTTDQAESSRIKAWGWKILAVSK